MVGEAIFRHARMIVRNRGNDSNGSKINSRRWVASECGIQIWDNGDDWAKISISQWWLYLEGAFAKHVLVSPYEIYEILMGYIRGAGPRKKLGIGPTGNAGVAAISAMVETIEGTVGGLEMVEANSALAERGVLTELPAPNYGYLGSCAILHEGESRTSSIMIG